MRGPLVQDILHHLTEVLDFAIIKSTPAHTLCAHKPTWESTPDRNRQPLMFRIDPVPGGSRLEVTIIMANVPMAKLSVGEFLMLTTHVRDQLIDEGRRVIDRLNEHRDFVITMLSNDHSMDPLPIDLTFSIIRKTLA